MIKFLELKEKLKNHYPCLYLCGNDAWIQRKAVSNVCAAYNVPNDGFSVDYLETPALSDVITSCLTPSMFCDKKIVVCTSCAFMQGNSAQDAKRRGEAKRQISELIKKDDGSFCLLVLGDDEKLFDGVEGAEKVNCNKLDNATVAKWIIAYAKRQGVAVDRLCADKIAGFCLCDMSRVENETQKLIDNGEVTVETINALVHKDAEYAVFDLSKHISEKNAGKALELYKGLVARGEECRQLFGLLYSFYRRAYYVKTSDYPQEELASYLGVKAGAIGFAKDVAAKYKPMQLKRALDYFAQADERLKKFVDENDVMNLLIMQLSAL